MSIKAQWSMRWYEWASDEASGKSKDRAVVTNKGKAGEKDLLLIGWWQWGKMKTEWWPQACVLVRTDSLVMPSMARAILPGQDQRQQRQNTLTWKPRTSQQSQNILKGFSTLLIEMLHRGSLWVYLFWINTLSYNKFTYPILYASTNWNSSSKLMQKNPKQLKTSFICISSLCYCFNCYKI